MKPLEKELLEKELTGNELIAFLSGALPDNPKRSGKKTSSS